MDNKGDIDNIDYVEFLLKLKRRINLGEIDIEDVMTDEIMEKLRDIRAKEGDET